MKLIVAGATGYVAQEVIRQSLGMSQITSVVALARKPVVAPDSAGENATKLKSVVIEDYEHYSDEVKREFTGADACIWTVAITPTQAKSFPFEEVTRICQTSTLAGLQAIHDAGVHQPFRFIYMSGDQTKAPSWVKEYNIMRAETEDKVLAFAAQHRGDQLEACVAKPGIITLSAASRVFASAVKLVMGIPSVSVPEVAAAMLQQVVNGFEKEPLQNDDLVRIGRQALQKAS
ncbi:putative nucleoside-diphosphate-sugar epimerase [Mycena polygramma]|nr:putative nucleoside-diphosphate-sugar epimerase [Mycena polygramma]